VKFYERGTYISDLMKNPACTIINSRLDKIITIDGVWKLPPTPDFEIKRVIFGL
jgi:hypothetical protein